MIEISNVPLKNHEGLKSKTQIENFPIEKHEIERKLQPKENQ